MKAQRIKTIAILLIMLVMGINDVFAQCAMCRGTVENNVSYGETSLASGLNLGILYLFVTPYLLFMAIAFFWYKKSRQHKKKIRLQRYP